MLSDLLIIFASAACSSAARLGYKSFPNYIIPVSSAEPDVVFGTQYGGNISVWHDPTGSQQTIATEIVFDGVPNVGAEFCTIEFDLARTGPYELYPAQGTAKFFVLNLIGGYVKETDTWNSRPAEAAGPLGEIWVQDGVATGAGLLPTMDCGAPKVQILLQAKLDEEDFDFRWFELDDRANGIVNGVTLKQWVPE